MEHCKQEDRLARLDAISDKTNRMIGEFSATLKSVNANVVRLDKRINGAFSKYEKHVDESEERILQIFSNTRDIKAIKEEKLNTTKNSQWRIGLIAGLPGTVFMILKIIELISKG